MVKCSLHSRELFTLLLHFFFRNPCDSAEKERAASNTKRSISNTKRALSNTKRALSNTKRSLDIVIVCRMVKYSLHKALHGKVFFTQRGH